MRSVAVAAVPNIVQRSVRLYKAHRSPYTRFDDRFIAQSSGGASRPLLRAYTTFVVFGVLLVRSDNLQGRAEPCSIRHPLYSPSGQLGIFIFGSWKNWTGKAQPSSSDEPSSYSRCVSVPLCSADMLVKEVSATECSRGFVSSLRADMPFQGEVISPKPRKIGFQETNNDGAFQPWIFRPRLFYRWPTETAFLNF